MRASAVATLKEYDRERGVLDHVPALDGLRAIAAIVLIAWHCDVPFIKGGYAGVDIFFVLSGFLITTIIVREKTRTGNFSYVDFYFRRALRLLPPLIIVCFVVFIILLATIDFGEARKEIAPSLLYVADLTRPKVPNVLAHTWSLALEEQFYVLWPVLLLPILLLITRRSIAISLLLTAAAVALWRSYLYTGSFSYRTYDWPDVHSDGIMLGCALALLDRETIDRIGAQWPLALAFLTAYIATVRLEYGFSYHGGWTLVNLSSAVIIARLTTSSRDLLSKGMSRPLLVWIGTISYGLYLWHHAVLRLLPSMAGTIKTILVFAISFCLASMMFYWIELPLHRFRYAMSRHPVYFIVALGWLRFRLLEYCFGFWARSRSGGAVTG